MKRVTEIEMDRAMSGKRAINLFFKIHPELDYWKEEFEYMLQHGIDFSSDGKMADGTKNKNWRYALHLDESENRTYICVIERE